LQTRNRHPILSKLKYLKRFPEEKGGIQLALLALRVKERLELAQASLSLASGANRPPFGYAAPALPTLKFYVELYVINFIKQFDFCHPLAPLLPQLFSPKCRAGVPYPANPELNRFDPVL
jgi:hypothetical protein